VMAWWPCHQMAWHPLLLREYIHIFTPSYTYSLNLTWTWLTEGQGTWYIRVYIYTTYTLSTWE
jgi:hypothetical protein